jgi:hypothetical protein
MKKLAILVLVMTIGILSCKKNTTPNRVGNRLLNGPWKIGKFVDSTVNRTTDYTDVVFDFMENWQLFINAKYTDTVDAKFDIPENTKNPATLVLTIPSDSLLQPLRDDWSVVFLSKEEFRLVRLNGKKDTTDECIFRKL